MSQWPTPYSICLSDIEWTMLLSRKSESQSRNRDGHLAKVIGTHSIMRPPQQDCRRALPVCGSLLRLACGSASAGSSSSR